MHLDISNLGPRNIKVFLRILIGVAHLQDTSKLNSETNVRIFFRWIFFLQGSLKCTWFSLYQIIYNPIKNYIEDKWSGLVVRSLQFHSLRLSFNSHPWWVTSWIVSYLVYRSWLKFQIIYKYHFNKILTKKRISCYCWKKCITKKHVFLPVQAHFI